MKAIHPFKIAGLLGASALSAALIFIPSAFAERPYVVDPDLDRKIAAGPESLSGDNTYARAINDAGQVVRESTTVGGTSHAFMTGSKAWLILEPRVEIKAGPGVSMLQDK